MSNRTNTVKLTTKPYIIAIILFFTIGLSLFSQQKYPQYKTQVNIDWINGIINASIELDIASMNLRLPSGRSEAEYTIENLVPELVRNSIKAINYDSYRTVGESIDDGTLNPELFESYLEDSTKIRSSMSRDLSKLSLTYRWKLSKLVSLYVKHEKTRDLVNVAEYTPTRDYTGIIIYAQGLYPVRGEHREAKLNPCLFPRVFDENMNQIAEKNLIDPEYLCSWGINTYAYDLGEVAVLERAGNDPLRIMASSVFGSLRTDIVISPTDAMKILSSQHNRDLIKNGKIVFVIDK